MTSTMLGGASGQCKLSEDKGSLKDSRCSCARRACCALHARCCRRLRATASCILRVCGTELAAAAAAPHECVLAAPRTHQLLQIPLGPRQRNITCRGQHFHCTCASVGSCVTSANLQLPLQASRHSVLVPCASSLRLASMRTVKHAIPGRHNSIPTGDCFFLQASFD